MGFNRLWSLPVTASQRLSGGAVQKLSQSASVQNVSEGGRDEEGPLERTDTQAPELHEIEGAKAEESCSEECQNRLVKSHSAQVR